MTAPLRSTPHASALPASQTAPVAEFRCLFTHDVKRKQKRWQDGYLKFHTFNNRVMVSDESRNHVGDTYYKESDELHEGDELSLDKGVLVEVAEAMGISQTDLAPIIGAKKTKEPSKEAAVSRPTPSAAVRPFQRPTSVAPSTAARTASQLRHKSLNTLLGTPKGPVGKAVPMKSPYEARKEKENEDRMVEERLEERAPKRQKVDQRTTGWRASSPVHVEEPSPIKPPPLWPRTADVTARQTSRVPPLQPFKPITISSESDPAPPISSGVTLPSTPARAIEPITPRPQATSKPMLRPVEVPEVLPVQAPKPLPSKVRLPKKKVVETPKRPAPTSSPPVSASNRLANVDFALQPAQELPLPPSKPPPPPRSPSRPKAKSLRLSTGVRRATLLCQSMPRPSSRSGSEPRASNPRLATTKTSRLASKEPSPTAIEEDTGVVNRLRPASTTSPVSKRKQKSADVGSTKAKKSKTATPPLEIQEEALDDPEIMYGMMDQQLLVLSSPEASPPPRMPPPTKVPQKKVPPSKTKAKTKTSDGVTEKDINRHIAKPSRSAVDRAQKNQSSSKVSPTPDITQSTSPTSHSAIEQSVPRSKDLSSPRNHTVFDHPLPQFKDISPARNRPPDAPPKSASLSPKKLPLSTGGFQKKSKPTSSRTKSSRNFESVNPAPRAETVALPPHPLRASKKGPTMTTTELASVLSKSKTKKRAPIDDPIEDDGALPTRSPARKIRRVRSENDAPIPSTADDWEQRNLPKTSSTLTEPEAESVSVPQPEPKKKVSALAALVKRTDPRKKFQRTQSLNVDTTVVAMVEPELPSPVIDKDVGPWSTEAFDLFDWRPPAKEDAGG